MFYLMVENGEIIGKSQCLSGGEIIDIEVTEQIYNNYEPDKYIYKNNKIIENPNWEEIQAQKETERINNLTMTPLDFIGVLVSAGLTLEQINAFLESNLNIKMQLTYCSNVYCGVVKQFLPMTVNGIKITAEMVETAFRIKNEEGVA